jgi:hypothetical protein
MSRLVQDEDPKYLLVKRNGETIANYSIDKLKELQTDFKDICSTSEFDDYDNLDNFVDSIYFLEFLEYFLYYLHSLSPKTIPYKKNANKMTKDELFIMSVSSFRKLIGFAYSYLYNTGDLRILFDQVYDQYTKILNTKLFTPKDHQILIRLYSGFLCFLELLIKHGKIDESMTLFVALKNSNLEGKLNKTHTAFNESIFSIIHNFFTNENMIELRKKLLFKFRLFQRKYLSAIAKLRKNGPLNALPEKSREIKKELNKNKNVDYKAYEVFCLYVLVKEENEAIYDYLAGIHKNSNGNVIHKNINNNKVANIKANTKKTHHKEYVEKSKEILKNVEKKIKEHGDIIDKKTKHQVERIRKLFDSEQFKNMTLSFGNNNSPSIGGKIIQDCKTIRAINKEIDKMLKEHMNKETKKQTKKQKQEKREEMLKLFDELKSNTTLANDVQIRKKLADLVRYDLLRKTKNLSQEELNTIQQIKNKLNEILPKS